MQQSNDRRPPACGSDDNEDEDDRAADERHRRRVKSRVHTIAEFAVHARLNAEQRARSDHHEQQQRLRHYSTILLIGSSRMSRAPAAFKAGIRVLTPRLPTTDSTARMSLLAS